MKKILLIIIIILLPTILVAQFSKDENTLTITGFTIDESTSDTVPLAIIELMINDKLYLGTKSDFDGFFKMIFCADQIEGQKSELIITAINYVQKKIDFRNNLENPLEIRIRPDSERVIDKEAYTYYSLTRMEECGTDRIDKEMALNRLYKHCDGRIKRYNDIVSGKENMNLWTAIE